MHYIYGDHPTFKELFYELENPKKAKAQWKALQKLWKEKASELSLVSKENTKFWYFLSPYLLTLITKISEERGFLEALSLTPPQRKKIEQKALVEEAYYSSRIEGARSSFEEALRFLKKKVHHTEDESLQMIVNNKKALEYARGYINKPLSHDLIGKLQELLTDNTHKHHPITRGEYRHGPVYIVNQFGEVVYEGPPHEKVYSMMNVFIKWINEDRTMLPLIKAGIVHLYFVHVHPFDDGNGRTARALSNLILAKEGFEFINMLSLSSYFDHKRSAYYRAIQDVRAHDYDLSYFLIFYAEALFDKIKAVKKELKVDSIIKNIKSLLAQDTYAKLNRRHSKSLQFMIREKEALTTKKYCKLNKCSDETARKDFIVLLKHNLIEPIGEGRNRSYKLSAHLEQEKEDL